MTRKTIRPAFIAAAILACVAQAAAQDAPFQPEETTALQPGAEATAQEFMVVTAHPLASRAGFEILEAGGSAADAAVAVQLVLNLVEPQSSGLGGGGFLLHWNGALEELTSFDARETAPLAAGPDYWLGDDGMPLAFWDAVIGGRSVGVPGIPMLLERIHEAHGRLPWGQLFEPAIDLAENGFPVSPRMAASIASARGLDRFGPARDYFFGAEGAPLAAGERLRNPDFARTLRLFADRGAAPFYTGAIARDIVATVASTEPPGQLTMADLAAYEVIERPPVCIAYRGKDICGMGPPSSGALTVGQILGILAGTDLGALGPGLAATHLFLEAGRLAFADRGQYIADSDFTAMPDTLLDRSYLAARAALIDPEQAMGTAPAGRPPWDDVQLRAPDQMRMRAGTTHFVIVDGHGDMVSATTTIETGFGSRLMTNGFLLNNELTDFSFVPEREGAAVANRIEGGKRPRSSMAPTIVLEDGYPVLLIGSPGGANIIPYVAAALIAVFDWNMPLEQALNRPHVLNRNGPTFIEEGPGAENLAARLEAMGHDVRIGNLNSGLHAIRIGPAGLTGAADMRREGLALGR